MRNEFWHDKWRRGEIGFHEGRPNAMLQRHWARLAVPPGSRVLVPLSGKAVDLMWLATQGYQVTGIELSEQAVREFFAEHALEPKVDTVGSYRRFRAGRIELLCGDFFHLAELTLDSVAAVYDRAALIALPEPLRARYARTLQDALPRPLSMLLVTLTFPSERQGGPPFFVSEAEIRRLYEQEFTVELLECRNVGTAASAQPTVQECAWSLVRS